jgi:hypothetical protein
MEDKSPVTSVDHCQKLDLGTRFSLLDVGGLYDATVKVVDAEQFKKTLVELNLIGLNSVDVFFTVRNLDASATIKFENDPNVLYMEGSRRLVPM